MKARAELLMRRLDTLLLAALMVVASLVFWPGLHGGFIFDDLPNLVQSESWKIGSLTPSALRQVLDSDISGLLGRPLAMLSFAANHAWTGQDPFALKLTNLLMHLVNGVLAYVLCRQLLPLAMGTALAPGRARVAASLVAGAWLLHPLQVSTVLYSVQRMEIGAAGGVLASLAAYLLARKRLAQGRPCLGWFALATVMFLLGLGFKESALVALPLLLLIDALVLGFRSRGGEVNRVHVALHAAWLVPALLVYGLVVVPESLQAAQYAHREFSMGERLLSQGPVLAMYLGQILLPLPDDMVFYYDHLRAPEGLLTPPWTAATLAGLLVLAASAVALRKRWPLASLGIAWFFACHVLTSNVLPLELAFEHRNYLALLGPLLVASEILARVTRGLNGDAALSIALAPLLALAGLCFLQASTWGDPIRLATALAGRNPDSPRANYDLGMRLYEVARGDRASPQWSLARKQFEAAARLPGSSALPEQALVVMDSAGETAFAADRWRDFEAKLLGTPLGPDNVGALHSVVACRLSSRCALPDAAVAGLLQRMEEKYPEAFVLSIIRANFIWNGLGDREAAIAVLQDRRALGDSPYQVDLALAEFLLASKLHRDWTEAASILAGLKTRDLPPASRSKVGELESRLGAAVKQPEPK